MQEKENSGIRSFKELQFHDDFMFAVIMRKEKYCRPFLETVLGIKIQKIVYPESQKTIDLTQNGKSVRLDVYVNDDENTVYNIEMQTTSKKNMPKRSRYYQAMIDLNILDKGQDYTKLTKSFVIFVCTFDFYKKGRHIYRFENLCTDDTSIRFGDETIKVVLNTKGTLNDVSDEMLELLAYIDNGQVTNSFTQELDREVNSVRNNEKWRREYMTLMMALEEKKQEGVEELEQAILLVRNGCSTVEALEENGISRAIAEKALKLA